MNESMEKIPEPLRSILRDYCHVEWAEEMNELSHDVQKADWSYDASAYKDQLGKAIHNLTFSLEEYENVTGEDFDSEEELKERLKGIWSFSFPGEEP